MRSGRLAWIVLAVLPVMVGIALALDLSSDGDVFEVLAFMIIGLPFAVVGALVASRQPAQPIGWLMLSVGMALAIGVASDGAVSYLLEHPDSGVSPGWPALLSAICFRVFFLSLVATLLLIPTGKLPSRRWRVVAAGVVALAASSMLLVFNPGVFGDWETEGVRNPVGIERLGGVMGSLDSLTTGLTMLLLLVPVGSVAVRFRGARGVERAQLRWIAAAVVGAGLTWVVMIVGSLILGNGRAADALWAIALISIGLIPVGIGFAVLRYRLYEIDRIISRTLVYGALTVILGAAYVGFVLLGQAVFSSFAGGSNLAIAVSTLVVAALFLPLRSRVQGVVDRRFYRRRYDAQRTLESFGTRLREQIELDDLRTDLVRAVDETMQPAHVSLWLPEMETS